MRHCNEELIRRLKIHWFLILKVVLVWFSALGGIANLAVTVKMLTVPSLTGSGSISKSTIRIVNWRAESDDATSYVQPAPLSTLQAVCVRNLWVIHVKLKSFLSCCPRSDSTFLPIGSRFSSVATNWRDRLTSSGVASSWWDSGLFNLRCCETTWDKFQLSVLL
jgi:hypothetical protein